MTRIKSISPIDNKAYYLDESSSNDSELQNFLDLNSDKKLVVVMGLGFVGTVMSLVCANSKKEDYVVVGLDLATKESYWKIGMMKEGKLNVVSSDKKVLKFFENTKKNKNLFATHDKSILEHADIIIIDINLDVQKIYTDDSLNFDVNLEPFKKAIKTIGSLMKETALALVETTVPPGTCKKVVEPIIQDEFLKRNLTSTPCIGHSYERVMPGPNYIDSIINFPRVFSGIDEKSEKLVETFLESIINTSEYPLTKLKNTQSSEIAKVLENSYRAMNIAFIAEWSRLAENSDSNLFEIVDAIRKRDTHKNIMLPGIGVGGYCLTKDPLLASWAAKENFDLNEGLKFSEQSVFTNNSMPNFAFNFLKDKEINLNKKKVGILGVAYGPGISDTRSSPVEKFINLLKKENCDIYCHDPYVKFWDEMNLKVSNNLKEFLSKKFDILIACTKHQDYLNNSMLLDFLVSEEIVFYDAVKIFDSNEIDKFNSKYFLLGSGSNK